MALFSPSIALIVLAALALVATTLAVTNQCARRNAERGEAQERRNHQDYRDAQPSALEAARRDARERQRSNINAAAVHRLAEYLPGFGHNPLDAFHAGGPIDLIIFDGLSELKVSAITLNDTKTGGPRLGDHQVEIKRFVTELAETHWPHLLRVPAEWPVRFEVGRPDLAPLPPPRPPRPRLTPLPPST